MYRYRKKSIDYIENMQISKITKCSLVNIPHHKQQNRCIPRQELQKIKLHETNRLSKVYVLQYGNFMNVKNIYSLFTSYNQSINQSINLLIVLR
jgi:hypothetical protein